MTAMRRVEEQYMVVGVTELWEETLEVLEHLLPAFFKGALKLYRKRGKIKINSNHVKVLFLLLNSQSGTLCCELWRLIIVFSASCVK